MIRRSSFVAAWLVALVDAGLTLSGCSTSAVAPDASPAAAPVSAWIELGPGGAALARAVVPAAQACPSVVEDGIASPMRLRVAASTPSIRDYASGLTKPAVFDVNVCEGTLKAGTRTAEVDGRALPVPSAVFSRIVVLGDSGCRIKGADWQDCNNQKDGWPFARIAAVAAGLHPDLVIHVGDYHYRETPCPAEHIAQCGDSPWGYGWDAWRADFFQPGRPLLEAAPWVLLRGNHEECSRAGQGWFRFLAAEAYSSDRSCDDASNDADANFSAPFAVPLGGGAQAVVFDSAHAGTPALDLNRPEDLNTFKHFQAEAKQVDQLARAGRSTWFLSHHPVLAFAPDSATHVWPGSRSMQAALGSVDGSRYFPEGVDLAVHGHVHLFQAIDFSSGQAATIDAGTGGDNLDNALPMSLPAGASPAPGAVIAHMTHASTFGFLMFVRTEAGAWGVDGYRKDGSLFTRCTLAGKHLACQPDGLVR